jgi:hypothetical protein
MNDIVGISKEVLTRLSTIACEKHKNKSVGQLIFPTKSDLERISEQELRQVYSGIFKVNYQYL